MRIIGLLLVMLGGLALGLQGFTHVTSEPTGGQPERPLSVPPVFSGIAVVSGLLLLASGGRRGED